jgi:Zn-dependent protease with chaperone function
MMALVFDSVTIWLVVAYAVSLATWLAGRTTRNPLDERAAWGALLLPAASGAAAVALGFWPTLRSSLGGAADHCLDIPGPHLCWVHAGAGGQPHDMAILALLSAFAAHLLWLAFQAGALVGRLAQLEWLAVPGAEDLARDRLAEANLSFGGPITVLDLGSPICFVSGASSPRLILSTGLLTKVEREDLAAVLAHEIAHVRRRDPLWRLVAHAATLFHLPGLGRAAFDRWASSVERACDRAAADHVGSPDAVAGALVRYERLMSVRGVEVPVIAAAGFGSATSEVADRVHALLEGNRSSSGPWLLAGALLVGAAAFWQVDTLHSALEAILGTLHA